MRKTLLQCRKIRCAATGTSTEIACDEYPFYFIKQGDRENYDNETVFEIRRPR
jgi:hypothetical protein